VTANRCYPRPHVSGHGRSGGSGAITRRSVLSQLASQLVIGAKAAPKSGLGSAPWIGAGRPLRCRGTQPPNGLGTSLSAPPNTQASSCVSAIGEMRLRYAFFVAAKVLAAGRSSYRLLETILIIGLTVSGWTFSPRQRRPARSLHLPPWARSRGAERRSDRVAAVSLAWRDGHRAGTHRGCRMDRRANPSQRQCDTRLQSSSLPGRDLPAWAVGRPRRRHILGSAGLRGSAECDDVGGDLAVQRMCGDLRAQSVA